MLWQLLACGAAIALACNTEYEIEKAIQFLRDANVEELPRPQVRVVDKNNFTEAPMNRYPFVVLTIIIGDNSASICSGTVVANKWVLTDGTCYPGKSTRYHHEGVVLAGDVRYNRNRTFERSNIQIRTASYYVFSPAAKELLLMKLYRPFILYRRYVNAVDLTGEHSYPPNLNISATAVGFANPGREEGIMTVSNFWTIPGVQCSKDLGKPVLCSRDDPLKSVCDADRGGPLLFKGLVYGIIRGRVLQNSSDDHCGAPVAYNTFWFAGGYAEWIYVIVGSSSRKRHREEPAPPVAGVVRSPAAALLAGECWPLPCLLSYTINLLSSH